MSGTLKRSQPVLDSTGAFDRSWYQAITDLQKNVNGLVAATLYSDTGVVNAMVISTGASVLTRNLTRYVKPAFTNTSAIVTLNDSGLGAKQVILSDGTVPSIGQIQAGVTIQVIYNGTAWEIVNLSTASASAPGNFTVGGNLTVLGASTLAGLTSGTYTPTLFNTTNIAASTASVTNYLRIFDRVIVFGQVTIDPTAAVASLLGMSLPVASNIGAAEDLGGTGAATTVTDNAIGIIGDAANDRASFSWIAVDMTNHVFAFHFSYRVI